MTRIPALAREEMDGEQRRVHDDTAAQTGRVGRGPAIGYAYAPGQSHFLSSAKPFGNGSCVAWNS